MGPFGSAGDRILNKVKRRPLPKSALAFRYFCLMCSAKIKEKGNLKVHYLKVHKLSDSMATVAVSESRMTTDADTEAGTSMIDGVMRHFVTTDR